MFEAAILDLCFELNHVAEFVLRLMRRNRSRCLERRRVVLLGHEQHREHVLAFVGNDRPMPLNNAVAYSRGAEAIARSNRGVVGGSCAVHCDRRGLLL